MNIAALKINMAEIGLLESSHFFIDGQQVIDYVTAELEGLAWGDSTKTQQPIRALLLDF